MTLDAAANRLRKASYQDPDATNDGPQKYTFFLLDTQPGGWGVFCWYKTKRDLLHALARDLVGFMYTIDGSEEEEVTKFLAKMSAILSSNKTGPLSEATRKRIDKLLTGWHVPFIGTYDSLLTGKGKWERELRTRFREKLELSASSPQAPITKEEREGFEMFVSQPFE